MMPPVMFEVEVNGKRYDEMHVDGGAVNQLFFLGAMIDLLTVGRVLGRPAGSHHVDVIENAGDRGDDAELVARSDRRSVDPVGKNADDPLLPT